MSHDARETNTDTEEHDCNEPGVQEKAALARHAYNIKLKQKRNVLNGLNADGISRLSGDQLKALLSIKVDYGQDSDKKPKNSSKSVSFCVEVSCLTSTNNSKPSQPITIDVNLPHVALAIGQSYTGPKFTLSAAYDTCAAICVGHSAFHLAIAEQLPHLVKSLIWAKDEYIPITLSGIVSDSADKNAIKPTSTLPAIIEYHMPYKSREGYQTSLKIALGDNVSVNTIIGLSMIRPAKFSLDLSDDVMEPGVLDTEPFPIIYKPTLRSMPDFTDVDEAAILRACTYLLLPSLVGLSDNVAPIWNCHRSTSLLFQNQPTLSKSSSPAIPTLCHNTQVCQCCKNYYTDNYYKVYYKHDLHA